MCKQTKAFSVSGNTPQDFSGGPVVETSRSNAGDVSLSPDWRGSHMPHGQKKKKNLQNINNTSNVETNSIRTLKMVHIKIKRKKRNTPYITPNLHDFHTLLLLPRTSFSSPLLANSYSSFQENAQVPLPTKVLFCISTFSTLPICFHSCYRVFITAAK